MSKSVSDYFIFKKKEEISSKAMNNQRFLFPIATTNEKRWLSITNYIQAIVLTVVRHTVQQLKIVSNTIDNIIQNNIHMYVKYAEIQCHAINNIWLM